MTQFIGWTAEEVADKEDAQRWEDLHGWLHTWGRLLRDRGVATLYESVTNTRNVPARVLRRPSGERFMTDLRHVAQLLHDAAVSEGVGPTALANWLGRRIAEADRDNENEERTRRLESDAQAVQVITVHRSKGLEFPVVLVPYAWDGWVFPIDVPVFHDPDNTNRRTIDVGCPGTGPDGPQEGAGGGGAGREPAPPVCRTDTCPPPGRAVVGRSKGHEELPLVASPLRPGPDGQIPASGRRAQPDTAAVTAFTALGPEVSVERVGPPPDVRWHHDLETSSTLEVVSFDRDLDTDWRRASYSSITSAAHEQPAIASESEAELTLDEETTGSPLRLLAAGSSDGDVDEARFRSIPLALGAMPGGTLVGTLIHGVMERIELTMPTSSPRWMRLCATNRRSSTSTWATAKTSCGDCARPFSRRSTRLPACGCATWLEPGAWTSSGSSCRWWRRRRRRTGRRPARGRHRASFLEHLHRGDPVRAYADRLHDPVLGDSRCAAT